MPAIEIKRNGYLKKLVEARGDGFVKILTGMRRVGKSYLLDPIFKNYLVASGVKEEQIVKIDLDDKKNEKFLNPAFLRDYIDVKISKGEEKYYILLDEIQKVENFAEMLTGLLKNKKLEIYVTGSNSKFLSSDVITEFRGRGEEIRVWPLSFEEIRDFLDGNDEKIWQNYFYYGGLPQVVLATGQERKRQILETLTQNIYLNDIVERNNLKMSEALEDLTKIIASDIGSLTNSSKLEKIFYDRYKTNLSDKTIHSYLEYLGDAFIIEKAERYDIKGRQYVRKLDKFYFSDLGVRNALTGFRQIEENHLMENAIYNELRRRGFNVDVGIVMVNEGAQRKNLEVDFVCNRGYERCYIQSAFSIPDDLKRKQELRPLENIGDSFKKMIIAKGVGESWQNESGVVYVDLINFLKGKNFDEGK